jgi:hypothetical protein
MEIAALASFAILLIAWVVAPDRPRPVRAVETEPEAPATETQPLAA